MAPSAKSGHLAWLAAALGGQRHRLATLLQRMTALGMPGGLKPNVFSKFLRLLDQVADAREEEMKLLHQIETIEEKHRWRRAQHRLESPPKDMPADDAAPDGENEEENAKNGLLRVLAFWHLFMRRSINHKKQDLTED